MPDNSKPEKKNGTRPSENIQVPPIPKQTAGAVTGAAIGSIAGPVGAVVGGVVGALAGKAASSERPGPKAVRRGTARSKGALKRQPGKKPLTKSRKGGGRRLRAKGSTRTRSRKSSAAKAQKRTVRQPRKSRTRQKRSGGHTKRH
jgi:Glycine zipper